ncbi:outer membrane protein [Aliihoeflea sp. 40Bstr573]|uniref:outer membrane protein n=1 Tax=Aliihoeflea sp. 40Bstr573 TaxID=2696467 RepID=UPI002094A1B9|nr:outer membrane protein [Aliihoeflea sp. 40Bstr573]MCO6387118.1 outer membrane beta-barrel protein [Aliihoeflea sp. 40Bstr573]
MPSILRLAASVALLAALAGPSLAADYDPPIFIEQAPEYLPVEVGSGWYLRGDVGYNFDSRFENYRVAVVPGLSLAENNTSIFGGVGVGYHVNDLFRLETNLSFLGKEKALLRFVDPTGTLPSGEAEIDSQLWSGLVHGYFDLGTIAGFTPYVGAGAGVAYVRSGVDGAVSVPGVGSFAGQARENHFSFAYALGAGVNYQVSENLSVDLGYQYFNAPDAHYVSINEPFIAGEGIDTHQVKVGLRYDLW